jgi:hypothetical protein
VRIIDAALDGGLLEGLRNAAEAVIAEDAHVAGDGMGGLGLRVREAGYRQRGGNCSCK